MTNINSVIRQFVKNKEERVAELEEALSVARSAIEYAIDIHGVDCGGFMLAALNACDKALSKK